MQFIKYLLRIETCIALTSFLPPSNRNYMCKTNKSFTGNYIFFYSIRYSNDTNHIMPGDIMRLFFLSTAVLLIVSSCGRIPEPIGYHYSQQNKMQAGYHWEILASDTANEINKALILSEYLDTPVYVRKPAVTKTLPARLTRQQYSTNPSEIS